MRGLIILLSIVTFIGCDDSQGIRSNQNLVNRLTELVEVEDFFLLKRLYAEHQTRLSSTHSLYYSAIVNNVFNDPERSNEDINKLLAEYSSSLSDTLLNDIYHKKLWNHINLYEYGQAAEASDHIQSNFKELNDSTELEDLQNEIKIWRALENAPRQEVIKNGDATIPITRDKVGLQTIDVALGDSIKSLIFDTGANFSFMRKTLAKELGYQIIDTDFYITAATGNKVKSQIAVAEELGIGGLVFKNVLFLILKDEDLSFPQIDYYINGAIGFPVIEAMDEVRIRDGQIFVPQSPTEYGYDNFALNGLMPIIAVHYEGDTLRLHFDSGASSTSFFSQFYKKYREGIEQSYKRDTFSAIGGGGAEDFEGYVLHDVKLKVADSEAVLDNVEVHVNKIGEEESNFHGNFGQDYIKRFDEWIMSFKHSAVMFK